MYILSCLALRIQSQRLIMCSKISNVHSRNAFPLFRNMNFGSRTSFQRQTSYAKVGYNQTGRSKEKNLGPMGWFLLTVPISTFLLGTWQVKRRKWKLKLIDELMSKTSADPTTMPEAVEELKSMEYCPVKVRGTFIHEKELLMGPRSFIESADKTIAGESPTFAATKGQVGWLVITPFQLSDRNLTILVNRGWVPTKYKRAETRQEGQIGGEVELVGIVRVHEERTPFMPQNNPRSNSWFYRNLNEMCQATGSDHVFIDATSSSTVRGGPVGGQTCISLRNEHLSYIFTWYTLSAVTGYLWHRLYIARKPLL
ncbi:surfeit locus protein 1 isoform X1 [Hetaerina americana]|uniref:surfeit locus protein 1 isoform X1 n=1 Tax=Hetaerina americana TaxID=62018 RepID=UPI003A7F3FC8